MRDYFIHKLHLRELSDSRHYRRRLYSDRHLVTDLDIVQELDGHTGCVNALSWSSNGRLLASGSDDVHLNIHKYMPSDDDSSQQFKLATSVATGHTQNIFSVKFMPHSGDNTLITAAGDGEVRVFDLEYSGPPGQASRASTLASVGRRRAGSHTTHLTDGNTNARVYRSHGDRVKRIVTESSPHLFLSCSEDGEVRQWDLRLPSSAYPATREHRFGQDTAVPPPLISYKRYGLDLNAISCSASQPHYIALGGAHLHALLHDRRMTGRDKLKEKGAHLLPVSQLSSEDQERLVQATQCVRKFAPKGQQKMKRGGNGHITALKISDARPDEMLVSYSGDDIYSFDLLRDPNEDDVRSSRERKRKRMAPDNTAPSACASGTSTKRRAEPHLTSGNDASLRIRYENGQSEEIPVVDQLNTPLTQSQQAARHIANTVLRIKTSIFGSGVATNATEALGLSASVLSSMDDIMRGWRYPLDPKPEEVFAQQMLRSQRESSRRFVQAAGTLSRALGGSVQSTISSVSAQFSMVENRRSDLAIHQQQERFSYDFLKAILLWLDSGVGRLIEGFTRPADMPTTSKAASRLPIPENEAGSESVDEVLIPYLLQLAGDEPIIDVDANRFETDEERQLFRSERAAVLAFAAAVRTPFADLSSALQGHDTQDRQDAHRFWAREVGRGVLLNAIKDLRFVDIDRSFGGLGQASREITAAESRLNLLHPQHEDDELSVRAIDLVESSSQMSEDSEVQQQQPEQTCENEDIAMGSDGDDDDDDDEEASLSDSSSEQDDEDGVPGLGVPRFIYNAAFERRRLKSGVEPDVLCSKPFRSYSGHCNMRTVKDVNYFGNDDEYVVSGSDDGNVFIWDRKTTKLVNILEGDGEVVNVAQGHPYETLLAVSGIDNTIKIFSPDARAREAARLGQAVNHNSSASLPMRVGLRVARQRARSRFDEDGNAITVPMADSASRSDTDDYVSPTGLPSRRRMQDSKRIIEQNQLEHAGGRHDHGITISPDLVRYLLQHGLLRT